jgi:ribonuclease HIII
MGSTVQIPESRFKDFRAYLESIGFEFEDRPHQVFLARYPGLVVNLYNSGKVVFGGRDRQLRREIEYFINSLGGGTGSEKTVTTMGRTRIGTDEAGKGDYFGPLVIAGVLVDRDSEEKLRRMGVRDSKSLSDTAITKLAPRIKRTLGRAGYEVILIGPKRYNSLYPKLKNVNKLLGWGHARAMENLLERGTECNLAIADQFGDEGYIKSALMKKGRKIKLIQMPRAEQDVAVAAASILARDVFLKRLRKMGQDYGVEFPRGASRVVDFAKDFVKAQGSQVLEEVAKLHFRTTEKVLSEAPR